MSAGRHRKPSTSHLNRAALVATTGAFAAVPVVLSTGTASAAELTPTIEAPTMEASATGLAPSVDWAPIIACESGGNAHAQNSGSTASGLFQFMDGSWRAYGGTKFAARAKDATTAQQTQIANTAYHRSGLTPWTASRHCWHGKVSQPAPTVRTASQTTRSPETAHSTTVHNTTVHSATRTARHAAPRATPAGTYTVMTGDTLTRIASRHGLSWQSIRAANKSAIPRSNMLHPGEQLRLPTAADLHP